MAFCAVVVGCAGAALYLAFHKFTDEVAKFFYSPSENGAPPMVIDMFTNVPKEKC